LYGNSPKAKINKGSILSMCLKVPYKNNEVLLTVEEQERFDADWERRKNELVELKRATPARLRKTDHACLLEWEVVSFLSSSPGKRV
jgi:hypothetical protein